jgi:hypothetical protein
VVSKLEVTGLNGEKFPVGSPEEAKTKREFYLATFQNMSEELETYQVKEMEAENNTFKCLLHLMKWAGAIDRDCNVDQYMVGLFFYIFYIVHIN